MPLPDRVMKSDAQYPKPQALDHEAPSYTGAMKNMLVNGTITDDQARVLLFLIRSIRELCEDEGQIVEDPSGRTDTTYVIETHRIIETIRQAG